MVEILKSFFQKEFVKKIITLIILVWIMYMMKSILNLFLLTFMFTYLIFSLQEFILSKFKILRNINKAFITSILFLLLVIFIGVVLYRYVPMGMKQIRTIFFEVKKNVDSGLVDSIKNMVPAFSDMDIKDFSSRGMNYVFNWSMDIGKMGLNIFISLILSLFFIIEIEKIKEFFNKFRESRFSSAYSILSYFGSNFLNSFGKVIQAQILIAITNTSLSVVSLAFMGFSQLLGLGIMIFILSLIPVAGTFISLIPLSIMAYSIGQIKMVVYVLILIAVLHTLEAYVLNPKFMSSKTELPVFITFLVLVISEHFFGVWGLLLGIPLFIFFLDLFNIKTVVPIINNKKLKEES